MVLAVRGRKGIFVETQRQHPIENNSALERQREEGRGQQESAWPGERT